MGAQGQAVVVLIAGIACGLSQTVTKFELLQIKFLRIHLVSCVNSLAVLQAALALQRCHKIEPSEHRLKMGKIFRQQLSVRSSLNEKYHRGAGETAQQSAALQRP